MMPVTVLPQSVFLTTRALSCDPRIATNPLSTLQHTLVSVHSDGFRAVRLRTSGIFVDARAFTKFRGSDKVINFVKDILSILTALSDTVTQLNWYGGLV